MESQRLKILYIAGMGRNGGTLLDRILGSYDNIFSLGEFRFVWLKGVINDELCNCGLPFSQCKFWSSVFQDAFGGMESIRNQNLVRLYHYVDRTRYIPMLISPWKPAWFRVKFEKYKEILGRLYFSIGKLSRRSVLVDSSKFAGHAIVLASLDNVDLYVIHLVRDSRATAYSWKKKIKKPEMIKQTAYLKQFSLIGSTMQWMYRNISSELLRIYAKKFYYLSYEEFSASPQKYVESILRVIDEPVVPGPFINSSTVNLGESHTQSGNPMRFKKGNVEIRQDTEWKKKMSFSDKLIVTLLSWPLLLYYHFLSKHSRYQ
jgi:hypothetical protein